MASTFEADSWGGGGGEPVLIPGTLRGYRLMSIVRQYGRPAVVRLRGGWTFWESPEMRAECVRLPYGPWQRHRRAGIECRETPGDDCYCGIYNGYTADFCQRDRPSFHWVVVTANWGKIILGPHGFRAAHTRMLAVAPRLGNLSRWKQFHTATDTASGRQQCRFMAGFGVEVRSDLAALMSAYPPDDVADLRPAPEAA
jgi:hypothetical protein